MAVAPQLFVYVALVAYVFTRKIDTEDTPICGPGSVVCMLHAEKALLNQEVQEGLDNMDSLYEDTNISSCNCLPSCTSLAYNVETSQFDFNYHELFNAYGANISEFPGIQMSRLVIFFKDHQFISSERKELYGLIDFLANCGGILGLFTGFSFLSIFEIFYFLSLRLICNVKKYGRRYWSASPILINNDSYIH